MYYTLVNRVYKGRKHLETFEIEKQFEYPYFIDGFGLIFLKKFNTKSIYELMPEIDRNIRVLGLKGING